VKSFYYFVFRSQKTLNVYFQRVGNFLCCRPKLRRTRNNERQTLLKISLVLLLNQVTNLEQGSRSGVPGSEHF
jgi:hypothetical protein